MDKVVLKSATSVSLSDRFSKLQSKNVAMNNSRVSMTSMRNPSFPILPNSPAALNKMNPISTPINKQNRNINAKLRLSFDATKRPPGNRAVPNKRALTNNQTSRNFNTYSEFNTRQNSTFRNSRRGGFAGRGMRLGNRIASNTTKQIGNGINRSENNLTTSNRGFGRGRGRGIGRGRGRGGQIVKPKVEDLDKQLDAYMSKSKGYLDNMLEEYHTSGLSETI